MQLDNRTQLLIRKGASALLKRDLPTAYLAFSTLYQATDWHLRDVALIGLGDIVDMANYDAGKPPTIGIILKWKRDNTPAASSVILPDYRLAILLEGCLQRTRVTPHTLTERKTLRAMQKTLMMLQQILLNDPKHLVRFSAFIILNHTLAENQRTFIMPTLKQALRQEKNPALTAALAMSLES